MQGCGGKTLVSSLNDKLSVAKSDLIKAKKKQLETALLLYRLDHSVYPSNEEGIENTNGQKSVVKFESD